jgi:hypothetical protein
MRVARPAPGTADGVQPQAQTAAVEQFLRGGGRVRFQQLDRLAQRRLRFVIPPGRG